MNVGPPCDFVSRQIGGLNGPRVFCRQSIFRGKSCMGLQRKIVLVHRALISAISCSRSTAEGSDARTSLAFAGLWIDPLGGFRLV